MLNSLRDRIAERPKTRRFYLATTLFILVIGLLLAIALRAESFVENFALNLLTEIVGAVIVISLLEGRISKASDEMAKEIKVNKKRWGNVFEAWERGEIPESKVIECEQWVSWYKWIHRGDMTGWAELFEAVRYGEGLSRRLRSAVEWELEKVRKQAYETGMFSDEEEEIERQMQALLSYASEE